MLIRIFIAFSVSLFLFPGISWAEETSIDSKPDQQTDLQALERKVDTIRKELRESSDLTEYKMLSSDFDKVDKDIQIHETRLEQNQNLKASKEKQKAELESRLRIREQQLANDPNNPDLQQKVDSLKIRINDHNNQIQDIKKKIKEDQNSLEKELIPKKGNLQNDIDSHPITKKQVQLKATEKELANARSKASNDKLIEGLNNLNSGTNTFSVGKYLSVGREAEIKLLSPDNPSDGFLDRIIKLMTQTFGTLAVLFLIIAGFYMLTSEGDENRLQKGKNIFLYTIIGIIVAFTSYIIVQFVLSILFQ
jgi:type IV secretory pathway VirB2 component (pilin)